MKKTLELIAVFAFLLISGNAFCQALQEPSDTTFRGFQLRYGGCLKWCGPEKLYLHLDRTYYASGEKVWFAAYLKNASSLADDVESNYVYVDLIDENLQIRSRVKLKRKMGFQGHLDLPENLPTGRYVVRGYTIWQMNADPEYMFHQQIRVFNPSDKKGPVEKAGSDASPDVTFYPEGGRFFTGMRSRVAFKAMMPDGKSVDMLAALKDDMGNVLQWTATIHDGMGVFSFVPEKDRKYFLETNDGLKFELPDPSPEGASLQVFCEECKVTVIPFSPFGGKYRLAYRSKDDLRLVDVVDFDKSEQGIKAYAIGINNFTPGINHFLLINEDGLIVSERMFCIDDEKRVGCDVKFVSGSLDRRALTRIDISLSDTTRAQASISVVRGAFKNFRQDDDIVSYLLLSSELKGSINKPSEYFDLSVPASARRRYLDLLMMVQGWKYYDMNSLAKAPARIGKYKKEYSQSVSGRILRGSGTKIPKNFIFSVIVPKLKFNHFQDVSEGKNFIITELDFKENTDFFIKAQRPGLYYDYLPKWDGDVLAPPYKYQSPYGAATLEAKSAFAYDASADTLAAAVVTADQTSPFAKPVDGRDISESDLEIYSNMRLIAYLATRIPSFEYNGETMRNRRFLNSSFAQSGINEEGEQSIDFEDTFESVPGEVKLIVNEMEDQWTMYDQIRLSEIESISYSTSPDVVFNAPGGSVYIKLRAGVNRSAANMDESILYFVPLGWQEPSKFYSPRYDKGDEVPGYDGFDHRNTVHWRGLRKISGGRASEYFCTTDQNDFPYLVVVQGVNDNGAPFSCSKLIYN